MQLNEISQLAMKVRALYADHEKMKFGKSWTSKDIAMGFAIDVGDLLRIIMVKEGTRGNMEDVDSKLQHEICDCLWSVLVLAETYDIDLEECFTHEMKILEEKLRKQPIPSRFKKLALRRLVKEELPFIGKNWNRTKPKRIFAVDVEGAQIQRMFGRLASHARRAGVPLVVASMDVYPTLPELALLLEQYTAKNNIHYIDLSKRFTKDSRDYWIYGIDSYPNTVANKIFAEGLYEFLGELGIGK